MFWAPSEMELPDNCVAATVKWVNGGHNTRSAAKASDSVRSITPATSEAPSTTSVCIFQLPAMINRRAAVFKFTPGERYPKNTWAISYSSMSTVRIRPVTSESGTVPIFAPLSATILPKSPLCTRSAAVTPYLVANTRS